MRHTSGKLFGSAWTAGELAVIETVARRMNGEDPDNTRRTCRTLAGPPRLSYADAISECVKQGIKRNRPAIQHKLTVILRQIRQEAASEAEQAGLDL